ncbi:MAG: hypothetical protein ACK5NC_13540 [Vibrio sp.]
MNINDFILTVTVCLIIGTIIGFFLRDFCRFVLKMYRRYIRKPKYFESIKFEKPDSLR